MLGEDIHYNTYDDDDDDEEEEEEEVVVVVRGTAYKVALSSS